MIKDLTRYERTWYKHFPNSFNFGISRDHPENAFWSACNLPDMLYLQNTFILCETYNICSDSKYDIAHCLTDIGVCFIFKFFFSRRKQSAAFDPNLQKMQMLLKYPFHWVKTKKYSVYKNL